jgi:hypothetical protein
MTNSLYHGWGDPLTEPKRSYRYLVKFPVFRPEGHGVSISKLKESKKTMSELNLYYSGPGTDLFTFPVVRCTKPGFRTSAYRTRSPAGGYRKIQLNQGTIYDFTPVELEIIDSYDHDIEATITALFYFKGKLTDRSEVKKDPNPGKLIPLNNTGKVRIDGPVGRKKYIPEFEIYELTEAPAVAGSFITFEARKITLINSYIVGAEFNAQDYREDAFNTIGLTLDYESFDFEFVSERWPNTDIDEYRVARYEMLKKEFNIRNDKMERLRVIKAAEAANTAANNAELARAAANQLAAAEATRKEENMKKARELDEELLNSIPPSNTPPTDEFENFSQRFLASTDLDEAVNEASGMSRHEILAEKRRRGLAGGRGPGSAMPGDKDRTP